MNQKRARSLDNSYTLILSALTKRALKSTQPQSY